MPQAINKILDAASDRLAIIAGWSVLGLAVLITVEVVGRKFFAFSTQGADEIGGYVLAITAAAGFSYALYQKAHVRIEALLVLMPYSVQGASTILTLALLNAYAWFLAWRAVAVVVDSFTMHSKAPTPLETPLIYPHGIWTLALILFAVAVAAQFVEAVSLSARGRWVEVAQKFGVRSMAEELHDEVADAQARASSGGRAE